MSNEVKERDNIADAPELQALAQHTGDLFDQITSQILLTGTELSLLKDNLAFALASHTDTPAYRSMSDKMHILTKHHTDNDDRYWQCKAETEVHSRECINDVFKLKRAMLDVNEIEVKMDLLRVDSSNTTDSRILKIEEQRLLLRLDEYKFNMALLEKQIKYRIQEINDWAALAKTLSQQCKHSLTNSRERDAARMKQFGRSPVNKA